MSPYDERLYRSLLVAMAAQGNRVRLHAAMAQLRTLAGEAAHSGGGRPSAGTASILRRRTSTVTCSSVACYGRAPRQAVGLPPAMARSSSGKSVARAAATGGGTTYRGQMPVNWYAALVIIVVVGLGSIALAKYNYNKVPAGRRAHGGTTWHAALSFDICGTIEPALPASPSSATTGLTTTGSGVLFVAPKTSAEAGNNATLGKFADGYTGLTLTNTKLTYPSTKATTTATARSAPPGRPTPARSAWSRRGRG